MYLSRVQINTHSRQRIAELSHLGAYHNWVEKSFPGEIDKEGRLRHLWRIDNLNGRSYMLVLSPNQPSKKALEHYGIKGSAQIVSYDKQLENIQAEQIRAFRLTANPSYRCPKDDKVYPHVTVHQQLNWLLERTEKHGFKIVTNPYGQPNVKLTDRHYATLYHDHKCIRLSVASFEGILQITDAKLFKKTMTDGFGREKAYGMGLITVMPPLKQN